MKKLVILIPAFNESKTIGEVIGRLPKSLPGVEAIECIVVNDGSTDDTVSVAQNAGAFVVSHLQNRGVGTAFATGIEAALSKKADFMVNMDADGQFSVNDLPAVLEPVMYKKADIAIGNRFSKNERPRHMSWAKFHGNKAMVRIINTLIGTRFHDVSCGFRAYSREALLNLNLFGGFTYTQESLIDSISKNLVVKEVPIGVTYFPDRKSRVAGNLLGYAYSTSKIIIRTMTFHRPFKFFGYPGIVLVLIGLCFNIFLVGHRVFIGSFTPYKAYGFIGAGLMIFGFLMLGMALIADTIDKLRKMQEKTLYYEKRKFYGY